MSRASPGGRGGGAGSIAPAATQTTTRLTHLTLRGMLRMIRPSRLQTLFGIAAALATMLLAACSDTGVAPKPQPKPGYGRVLVYATAPASAPVTTLVIEVSGPGILKPDGVTPDTLAFNIQMQNGVGSGSIEIPAGPARVITVHAFDGVTETHRGTVTTDIAEGVNPTVSVTLVPLVGDVPITVTFGTTIVIVRPAVATLAVGDTLRMSAEIRDQNGNLVSGTVRWATLNPGRASVDNAGLVTMLDTGNVQVVGTYGTVGGSATITGTGALSQVPYQLTWNGSVSKSWSEPNNWTPSGGGAARVPTLTDSVVIPANIANQPQLDNCAAATVRDLIIPQGASLTISCGNSVNVYGVADVRGTIMPDVVLRPGARIGGKFARVYVYGDTARLADSVSATYFEINGAPAGLIMAGHKLTVGTAAAPGDLYIAGTNGYMTMADGDTLIVYGNVTWSGGNENGKLTGGVVLYRGTSFYGYRYKATGTNRLVFDRGASTQQQISGFDYSSDSTRAALMEWEIKSADGARICGYVQINDTVKVSSSGTPSVVDNTGCGGYAVRALGPVVTGANTTVGGYQWEIRHSTGTSLIAGNWQPTYTDFDLAAATVKPGLSYANLRFYASNKLTGPTNISGFLWVEGASVDLDLNGFSLGVAGDLTAQNGGTITMQNAADSLEIIGYANFASNFSTAEDSRLTAGVMRVGNYLYGYGFSASGAHRVVLTGLGAGASTPYVQGLSYGSRPGQGFQNLELATGATYGFYNDALVKGTLTVRTAATLQDQTTNSGVLRIDGDLVTEAGSTVKNYQMILNTPSGTSKIAGLWQPQYTDFSAAGIPVKPALGYVNLRFFAPNKLLGATNASGFLAVDGASVDLNMNGQSLGVAGYMVVQNGGTLTMQNAADSLDIKGYAAFQSNFSSDEDAKLTAGVMRVGGYFYGYGFSASGAHRVVLTGPLANAPYIQGMSYSSRPYQGFQNLEFAAGAGYGLYNDTRVKGVLTVRTGATVQDACVNCSAMRVDGDLVTEAGSTIKNYEFRLYNPSATQNVLGAFLPAYTEVFTTPTTGQLKPGLGYTNVQFYASITLPDSVTFNGSLTVDGAATILTLNGKRLHVTGGLDLNNNSVISMTTPTDSLIVDGAVYWDGGRSENGFLTDGVVQMTGPTFCATNYYGTGKHKTVFAGANNSVVRIDCVGGGAPPAQRFNNVDVQGGGILLNCWMWADGNVHVFGGASVRQNCNGQNLSVVDTLFTDPGAAVTNGPGYPGNNALGVALYDSSGTKYVNGPYDPDATYFTAAAQSYINPTLSYRYARIDGATAFQGNTIFAGQLDIINAAVVTLAGHKVSVGTTLNFDNNARLRMNSAADTLIIGADGVSGPGSTTYWDGGNEQPGDLTDGAILFYGARFYAPGYRPTAGTPHRFVFAANSGSAVSVEANPQFAQMEIGGTRTVNLNDRATINDTLRISAAATLNGTNFMYVKGGLVTVPGSSISMPTVYLDNQTGTRDVAGSFTPTNAVFRSGSPVVGAINPAFARGPTPQYVNVYVEGPYALTDSLRVAGSFNVTGDTNATAAQLTLGGHRIATGPTSAFEVYNQGSIVMNNPADSILAGDSFRLQSNSGSGTQITDGVVVVGIGGGSFIAIDRDNVGFTGNSKLVLNGQGTTGYTDIWTSTSGLRPLPNVDVTGTRPIRLQTGSTVTGALNVTQPIAITGAILDMGGPFTMPAGSSLSLTNRLVLRDGTGTSLINGAYSVVTTYFASTSRMQINGSLGYGNVDVLHTADVVGGKPLNATGWLRLGYGGDLGQANDPNALLSLPTGSSSNSYVDDYAQLQFQGTFTATGDLYVRSGSVAKVLSGTAGDFALFQNIYLYTGGTLDNTAAVVPPVGGPAQNGFAYRKSTGGSFFQQGGTLLGAQPVAQ